MEKSSNHGKGGRRPGAGRPRSKEAPGRLYTFRASGKMATLLDSRRDRSAYIKHCIENQTAAEMHSLSADTETAVQASLLKPLALPYFDISLVAGFPVPIDNDEKSQDIELLTLLCPHPESSYLVRVKGDSMVDAGIFSGDILIVDKSRRNPSPKEIAVCELNGEYTVKRVVKNDGGWSLVPANPDYPHITVGDSDDFSVWGTVTYIIHRARD